MKMTKLLKVFLACILIIATAMLILMSLEITVSVFPKQPSKVNITENSSVNRSQSRCDHHLEWGMMCPPLYTELRRKCDLMSNGTLLCPDIRREAGYPTRQAQLVITRMLRIFHLTAEKHGLYYWLSSGTLLGAARHKGFIPWDLDADIEMPLEDYVRFFQNASNDLPADIFFQNSKSDPWLVPEDLENFHKHDVVGIYERTWNPRLRDKLSCNKYCIKYNCAWHDGLMVDIFVTREVDNSVFPLKQMEFEGFNFLVPSNWRKTLEQMYGGNYMDISTDDSFTKPNLQPEIFKSCDKLTLN